LSVNGKPDSTVIRPAFRSYSLQLSYRGWCPNRSFNEEVISITKYLGSEGLWCQFPWTPITFSVALCCDTPCGWSLFVFFFFFFGQMKHYFTNKSTMPCGWSLNDQATHTVLKLHTISGPKSSHFHTFCGPRWKSNLGTTRLFRSPKNITPRSMLLGESHSPERFCNGSMHDHYNILESRCRSPLASHFGGTITCK
jgi:hypothetical protein